MLLSESVNALVRRRGRDHAVTEQMLVLSCEQCGEDLGADEADVSRESDHVVYSCPRDGAMLVQVGDDGSFHASCELTVRVGDDAVEWWNWIE